MIELIVLLTVFTYGTNFVLYLILKNKKSMPIVEKASIILGINMSVSVSYTHLDVYKHK
ncbi:hypothetical protein A5797_002214 [Enterococcus faecalis]|nr:hypothetical protein A5797_002214 [Enterococcus faecalis]